MIDRIPTPSGALAQQFDRAGDTALIAKRARYETEIGDTKQAEFFPQAKLKWLDNEANFSARFVSNEQASVRYEGSTVVWLTASGIEVRFRDLGGLAEGGGLAIDARLPTKPSSNKLLFTTQSKMLDFFYQPPLANVRADGSTWENSQRGGRNERSGAASGSYVAYHKTFAGDYTRVTMWQELLSDEPHLRAVAKRVNGKDYIPATGKNYKTGKAFSLLRPWAEDARGVRVWCDLELTPGTMTVTIPQAFLDAAVYPILVDPEFGYHTIGSTSADNSFHTDRCWAVKDTPASSGTVDSISVYTQPVTTGKSLKGAIFDNAKAVITNGVSNGVSMDPFTGGLSWITMTMPTPPSIVGGNVYYVGYLAAGGDPVLNHRYDTGQPAGSSNYDSTNSYASPQTLNGSDEAEKPSVYATYTESGASVGITGVGVTVIAGNVSAIIKDRLVLSKQQPGRPHGFKPMGDAFRRGWR